MSQELGLSFGSCLDRFDIGRHAVEGEARQAAAQALQTAEAAVVASEITVNSLTERESRISLRLQQERSTLDLLLTDQHKNPKDFSIPRGIFFVAVGLLLLVGDLTVLSGVLSRILGLPLRAEIPGGYFSVAEIVNRPWQAWQYFRNVLVLTSSVLLLGFFPKLFFDVREDQFTLLFRRFLRTVLVVSVLAVLATAFARFGMKLGDEPPLTGLFGYATVLIGIALPFASSFFSMFGSEKLGRRFDVWRLDRATKRTAAGHQEAVNRLAQAESDLAERQAALRRLAGAEYLNQETAKAVADFSVGYSNGVKLLLAGNGRGSVYASLRSIALIRKMK